MSEAFTAPALASVLVALVTDALFGDPAWLYCQVPHPAAAIGSAISRVELWLLKPTGSQWNRLLAGTALLAIVTGTATIIGIVLSAGARRATREVNSIGSRRPPPGRVITQESTDVRCLGWTNAASAAADGPPVAIVEQELPFALLDPLTQIRGTALVRAGGCTTIDEPGRIPGARRADRLSAAVVRIMRIRS